MQDQPHGTDGVIVAGNGVIHQFGIAIGVHQGDDGNFQAAPFGHGVVLALDVHYEHRGGVFVHGADAVQVLEQAGGFAAVHGLFLLAVIVHAAVGVPFLDLFEAGDGAFDGVEIGQGAAQPAFGDVKLAAGFGRFLDGFLGLLFGADKEHVAALG